MGFDSGLKLATSPKLPEIGLDVSSEIVSEIDQFPDGIQNTAMCSQFGPNIQCIFLLESYMTQGSTKLGFFSNNTT